MVNKNYVVGFLVDLSRSEVVLVRKNRPEWQAGKLNGVGGKIEYGETPVDAMSREFEVETGFYVRRWREFADLSCPNGSKIYFFIAFHLNDVPLVNCVGTIEDEEILVVPISSVSIKNSIPNLTWLIPMALTMPVESIERFSVIEREVVDSSHVVSRV